VTVVAQPKKQVARFWWWRPLVGAVILGLVGWYVGAGPILAGLTSITPLTFISALSLGFMITAANAWRWRAVAITLGLQVSWRFAVAAYYRSQFLNSVLPGGVLGDVHRALSHSRSSGDVKASARAVVIERLAAQMVLVVVTCVLLAALVAEEFVMAAVIAAVISAGVLGCAIFWGHRLSEQPHLSKLGWMASIWREVVDALRTLAQGRLWGRVAASSLVMTTALTTLFVLAAKSVEPTAPLNKVVPIVVITLLAASLPINIGGWGPREGAAAWAFGSAGLGADLGVAASVGFGVLAFVSTLPGLLVVMFGLPEDAASG
jgi:glycosyltransferase 2 family protein